MKRTIVNGLGAATCAIMLAVPALAAGKPAVKPHKTPAKLTARAAWPAETLSGKIMMINPALHLAVVKGPDGVPFDMIVTHATKIESGSQTLRLSDLSSDTNKGVSVKFVPERKGDVARAIQLNG